MGVSLKPSDAVAGGGGIDDVDVRIKSCRFRAWDYNGQLPSPVLGLSVDFELLTPEGGEANQVYSAGEMKHFVPSQDGREAVPVGGKTGLNENTNAMLFLMSLVNSGFPESKIGDDVSVFEGTECHVNQVPQPKRPGMSAQDKSKNVTVVSKIHKMPWEAAKGTVAAPAKAKASTKATAPAVAQQSASASGNGQAVTDKAEQAVISILSAKGGSIAHTAIAGEAFKLLASDPDRNEAVKLAYSKEFLGAEGKPWTFDGTTVSLG